MKNFYIALSFVVLYSQKSIIINAAEIGESTIDYVAIARSISKAARTFTSPEAGTIAKTAEALLTKFAPQAGVSKATETYTPPLPEIKQEELVGLFDIFSGLHTSTDKAPVAKKCYELYRSDVNPEVFPADIHWVDVKTIGTNILEPSASIFDFPANVPYVVQIPLLFNGHVYPAPQTLYVNYHGFVCLNSDKSLCTGPEDGLYSALGNVPFGPSEVIAPFYFPIMQALANCPESILPSIYAFQDDRRVIIEWSDFTEAPSPCAATPSFAIPFFPVACSGITADPAVVALTAGTYPKLHYQMQFYTNGDIFFLYKKMQCLTPATSTAEVGIKPFMQDILQGSRPVFDVGTCQFDKFTFPKAGVNVYMKPFCPV